MNSRSPSSALGAVALVFALLGLSAPARADIGPPGLYNCFDSEAAEVDLNPSYKQCSQHYDNAPAPQTTLIAPFPGYGDFGFIGQTRNDNADTGPFTPFGPGLLFGTLTLKVPQTGPFVIALASFDDYSLYLYDASAIVGGVVSIQFSTNGTTNELGQPYQLEYANLYAPVPEPSTAALMLAGLAAASLALRRRNGARRVATPRAAEPYS